METCVASKEWAWMGNCFRSMENMCCLKTELKDGDIVEFGVAVFSKYYLIF
jgi:hypothetical protein